MSRTALTPLLLVAGLAAAGCGADASTVVMAPSSFTGLTAGIDAALDDEPDWVIAGSNRLVRQLADGARADVLITADETTMAAAVAEGLVTSEPVTVATNRLVLAVAPGNPGPVTSLDDLSDERLLLGLCAVEVPCGRLAAEARGRLGLDLSVDTEEPNVRSLARKIAGGELDAGLIYATDAADLDLATVDDEVLGAFVTDYLAASLNGEPSPVIEFLRSPQGRLLLAAEGFVAP